MSGYKLIKATILDAMFEERLIEVNGMENPIGMVYLTVRSLEDDAVFTKYLTTEDICEIIEQPNRSFSHLELIRITEYLKRYEGTFDLVVKVGSQRVTNDMIKARAPGDLGENATANRVSFDKEQVGRAQSSRRRSRRTTGETKKNAQK